MAFTFVFPRGALGLIAAAALVLPLPAQAFEFSEGSFEEGSFEQAPASGTDDGAPSDGFDQGSFDDNGVPKPVAQAEDSPPPKPTVEDTATAVEEYEPAPTGTQDQADTKGSDAIEIDPQIYAFETRDFGVPGQSELRNAPFHGPTPLDLPGGRIVSTQGLVDAYLASTEMIVIDVLGDDYGLPDAFVLRNLSNAGHFNDRVQQQASIWLNNVTGGDASYPIVLYCSDPQCWLSYNGALRVIAAGYTNVYWYRGGLRAWEMAGLTAYPTGF